MQCCDGNRIVDAEHKLKVDLSLKLLLVTRLSLRFLTENESYNIIVYQPQNDLGQSVHYSVWNKWYGNGNCLICG